MQNTILTCTNNLVPLELFKRVLNIAFCQAEMMGDTEVIVVSQYPVFLSALKTNMPSINDSMHKNVQDTLIKEPFFDALTFNVPSLNLFVGEKQYSARTLCAQMQVGLECAAGDKIVIMEHDVLYPSCYLKHVSRALDGKVDFCHWKKSVFFDYNNGFFPISGYATFSRYAFLKSFFGRFLQTRIEDPSLNLEPELLDAEVWTLGEYYEGDLAGSYLILDGPETLDIHHGFNTGGQMVVKEYSDTNKHWGTKEEYLPLIDKQYRDAISKNSFYAYGLDVE